MNQKKNSKVVAFWKNNTHPITGFKTHFESDPYMLRMQQQQKKARIERLEILKKDENKLRG